MEGVGCCCGEDGEDGQCVGSAGDEDVVRAAGDGDGWGEVCVSGTVVGEGEGGEEGVGEKVWGGVVVCAV